MPIITLAAIDPQTRPAGLKTVMLVSDTSVLHMLGNGAVSGAILTLDNALSVNTVTDGDYCLAMILDRSLGADAVLVKEGWSWQSDTTISVGMEDSTLARYMLSRWLEHEQIPASAVIPRILLPTQHIAAFTNGQTDAIVTYQPFVERLRSRGAKVIFDSSTENVAVLNVLIVRKAVWPRAEPRVQQLKTKLWPQALTRLRQRDEAFWQGLSELTELTTDGLELALEGIQFVDLADQENAMQRLLAHDMPATSEYLIASGVHESIVPLTPCGASQ
ncbi:hypothetical protein ACFOD1_01535 [Pseudidiomarina halophila]|nr:hypothetical protein [Pseudidiomarina halophila]